MQNCEILSVGIFDSGVGGLSVLRSIRAQIPESPLFYVGDQAHVPYGLRSEKEIREFSNGITKFLIQQNVDLIVVACNTASAAALNYLREAYPLIPFVGMEPAIKPAAEQTKSGIVAVLATPATLEGGLYSSVVERFAKNVIILQDTCPGLVGQIEQGNLNSTITKAILEKALLPMLAKGIDTVVLGCTHYPFVIPQINEIVGPEVRVIDPAPAIARQVSRLLGYIPTNVEQKEKAVVKYFTTADAILMERVLPNLIGEKGFVKELHWANGKLEM
ncbi:MAG: glutamate racemase [Chloroflexota bacterium]